MQLLISCVLYLPNQYTEVFKFQIEGWLSQSIHIIEEIFGKGYRMQEDIMPAVSTIKK